MGDDYTIADISMLGWVRNLIGFYGARELVEFDSFPDVAGMARARAGAPGRAARPEHSGARLIAAMTQRLQRSQAAAVKARGHAGTGAHLRSGAAISRAARSKARIAA